MPNHPIFARRLRAGLDKDDLDWFTDPKHFKNYKDAIKLKKLWQKYNIKPLFTEEKEDGKIVIVFDEAKNGYEWNWETGKNLHHDERKNISYYTVQVFGRKSSFYRSAFSYGFRTDGRIKDDTAHVSLSIPVELEKNLKQVSIRAYKLKDLKSKRMPIWTQLRQKYHRSEGKGISRELIKQFLADEGMDIMFDEWSPDPNHDNSVILTMKTFTLLSQHVKKYPQDWDYIKNEFLRHAKEEDALEFEEWIKNRLDSIEIPRRRGNKNKAKERQPNHQNKASRDEELHNLEWPADLGGSGRLSESSFNPKFSL